MEQERTGLPPWLGPAGLAAMLLCAGSYWLFARHSGGGLWNGLDLGVYQAGGAAARHGHAVYDIAVGRARLPFTYPPATLVVFEPLSRIGRENALLLVNAAGFAALAATVWLTLGMLGYRRDAGRAGVTFAVCGLAVWLEPFVQHFALGQVNIFLMLLVVADLSLRDDRWYKGAGIGLAAAAKLVPGLFVLFLLLTGRRRAAGVAAGAFVAVTLLGAVLYPDESRTYWGGAFLDSSRVTTATSGPGYVFNQSLRGLAVRTFGGTHWGDRIWLPLAAAALLAGLWLAVLAHRRGEEALAMVLCAFTAILVSPVSWTHHWVWAAPALVVLADAVRRTRDRAQPLAASLLCGFVLVLFAWPLSGPRRPPLPRGILGVLPRNSGNELEWTLGEHLRGELYTAAVLLLFAVAAAWLVRGAVSGPRETPATAPPIRR
ncbi:glycosyltransferase 87 family protein [Phytohabitans houttuyneae]|uniref:Membrane protein n=1 Tax=Phytohabitans houttuyneae TaxID=1076126 RepID=A0A6V8KBZ2_9ACTN|nr:glycosyltransferase 87 family protein [Phytohabitans houttuyneae]GFJ82713.1 membrane protein [Phytohabitans houttuyneae]